MAELDQAGSESAVAVPAEAHQPRHLFVNDIPFSFAMAGDGRSMAGDATVTDALRFPGSDVPRPSVLATIADCMVGTAACLATTPRLAVTLDIVVRIVGAPDGDRLEVTGEIVKQGRSTVACEVRFADGRTGRPVALSYATFMASPRPQDRSPVLWTDMRAGGSMSSAFPDHVGARIVAPGIAEIELRRFVEQASGTLQGGIVALLGELAAESLTSSPVLDLDVRYLSAVRVGPGRATAERIGADQVRVEVRDPGNGDRLAALVTARVARSPATTARTEK